MTYIEPDQDILERFLREFPAKDPVVMLNLLKFLDQANYLPGQEASPCTGFKAFTRYSQAVIPLIQACGGQPIWQGRPAAMLVGPQDKDWHMAALVRYPSARAFVDMVSSEEYRAASFHRSAALEDSRLIAHADL